MKPWVKACICIGLCLMLCFVGVGYAELTDTLNIRGSAKIDVPEGLFIIDVSTTGTTNVDRNEVEFLEYSTTLDSQISRTNNGTGTVTYRITALNNTKLTYSYRGLYYQSGLSDYNGNRYISTSNGRSNIGVVCSLANLPAESKKVGPGQTIEFTVTYTVGNRLSANTNWDTLVNFQFGINVDGEQEAVAVVEEKFLNVLNATTTYEQLIDALDNKFDGRQEWTSNYIGNVTGSSSEDSVAVNSLFAGQLQITVGSQQRDATVMVKHENLDGNTKTGDDYVATNQSNGGVFRGYGCEMTLYLTVDPLTAAGQYVPVYAVVFTCDRDENGNITSEWYRLGTTYAGEANVVTYDGGTGTGSFVTDNWRAKQATYELVEGYSYNINGVSYQLNSYSYTVAANVNIESIVTAVDQNAINAFKTLLDDAQKIINNLDYAGSGIVLVEEAYAKLAAFYTVDANGNHVIDANITRAKLIPAITELHHAVSEALIRMDAAAKEQA